MARVTLRDVAKRAGVSTATVSNALNRPHLLTRQTLQRVTAAIAETGYVSDHAAKLLRVGVSRSVGVIVFDTGNPFFAELIHGVEDAASKHGLYILLANSAGNPEREAEYVRFMESQRVRGLIIGPTGEVPEAAHQLAERGTPFVVLGEASDDASFPTVSGDDTRGGALAARHLIEQGRRHLMFVGGPLSVPQLAKRLEGARGVVRDHPGVRLEVIETHGQSTADGATAAAAILARAPADRPDAIQAGTDLVALGLLQGLLRGGVEVPDDIAMIGYDDVPYAASAMVPLSTIRHPSALIGKTALDLLFTEFDGHREGYRRRLVFLPELVARESTLGRR
jgi:LacI family transcriptional regulator